MISKRWGEIYSENLPQDKGDKYDPIIFQQYLSNIFAKTGKYSGD